MAIPEERMLQILRETYEAFNRRDFDVTVERAHPEIVFVRPGLERELVGAEALRAWMEPDAFERQHFEPIEFRVAGNRVLVHQDMTARGAGSGIEIEIKTITVWTFDDDGRVTRIENYFEHEGAEALSALHAP
jgi:ketosteroid isomerase-like protein